MQNSGHFSSQCISSSNPACYSIWHWRYPQLRCRYFELLVKSKKLTSTPQPFSHKRGDRKQTNLLYLGLVCSFFQFLQAYFIPFDKPPYDSRLKDSDNSAVTQSDKAKKSYKEKMRLCNGSSLTSSAKAPKRATRM